MHSLTRLTRSESEGVADISTGAAEFVLRGLDEETAADGAGEHAIRRTGEELRAAESGNGDTGTAKQVDREDVTGWRTDDPMARPTMDELLRAEDPDNRQLLNLYLSRMFDQEFGEYRLRITDARYVSDGGGDLRRTQRSGFRFSGVISDDRGIPVADLQRKVFTDADDRIVVRNELIVVGSEQDRHQGISSVVNAGLEDIYRRNNVHRMEVRAMKDGGYVWARAGYDFDRHPSRLPSSISSLQHRIDTVSATATTGDKEILARIRERLGRPDDGDFPSPSELAALVGDDPGLGKTLMTGSTWHGVKLLG
ncbi:hypothetical protein ACIG56_05195 [Nocardia fusca]|uniref:hypothetical protein n=1 Tax=Nocardia fusca TaxID=941183 RepID=UPI0037C5306A